MTRRNKQKMTLFAVTWACLLVLGLMAVALGADEIQQEADTFEACVIRYMARVSDGPDPVGTRQGAEEACGHLREIKADPGPDPLGIIVDEPDPTIRNSRGFQRDILGQGSGDGHICGNRADWDAIPGTEGACDVMLDCAMGAAQFCQMYHGSTVTHLVFVEGSNPQDHDPEAGPFLAGICDVRCKGGGGGMFRACHGVPVPITCEDQDHPPTWDEPCGRCYDGPPVDPRECEPDGPGA